MNRSPRALVCANFCRAAARDYFGLKGGGIGWGLPATMGAALAFPDRPVLGVIGDGSAMYSIQGLWTAARYGLRSIFVICNNSQYLILKRRLHAYNGPASKTQTYIGIDLHAPAIHLPAWHALRGACGAGGAPGRPAAGAQRGTCSGDQRSLTCRSNPICRRRNASPTGDLCCMTDASEYFPPRLRGQVAVITGAARGLGRAYALRLARLGADIVVNDINLASAADVNETLTADTVMDEIRHLGRQALGIAADVTSEADVQRMFEEIFATFPQVHILINNAGVGVAVTASPPALPGLGRGDR